MRKLLSLLLLLLFYIALTGAIAEISLRVADAAPPVEAPGWFWQAPDPVTGWSHLPGSSGRSFNTLYEYDAQVSFNSRGIRGPESLTYAKPEGVYRVLLLGDSFIEAVQVNESETLGEQLRGLLAARTGQAVEVINAGVSGFGTDQQLLWLREEGAKYQPDLVLLAVYPHNDFMNNGEPLESANRGAISKPFFALENGALQLRYFPFDPAAAPPVSSPLAEAPAPEIPPGPLTGLARGLKERSALYRYFDPRIRLASPRLAAQLARIGLIEPGQESQLVAQSREYIPITYGVYATPLTPLWQEAVDLTAALFAEFDRTAAGLGAERAALLIPAPETVYPGRWQQILTHFPAMQSGQWDTGQPERLAQAALASAAIPTLSLSAAFAENASDGPLLYLEEDAHWTAAGHALAAQATVNFLGQAGIVPGLAPAQLPVAVEKEGRSWWEWFVLAVLAVLALSLAWEFVKIGPRRWLRQTAAGLATTGELFGYMTRRRQFFLLPLLVILLAFAGLLILAQASVVGPFIYTLI